MNTKRNPAIDLLRIVAMLLIIMTHLLQNAEVIWHVEYFSASYFVLWFMFFLVFCGMNNFALISGYVGLNSEFKIKKLFNLWFQAFFYGVAIFIIFMLISPENFDISLLKKAVMPVTFSEYWYFTAYFGLYIVSPVLNTALNNLEQKKVRLSIILFSLCLSLPAFIFYEDPFNNNEGYSFLWLCLLYMIGGYVRKYDVAKKLGLKKSLLLFWGCLIIEYIGKCALEIVTMRIYGAAKFGFHFVGHTTPFLLIQSVSLLLIFANLKVTSGWFIKMISFFAPTCLGIYFIHVNPFIFGNLLTGSTARLADKNTFYIVIVLLALQLGIFVVCALIDFIRAKIFKIIHM